MTRADAKKQLLRHLSKILSYSDDLFPDLHDPSQELAAYQIARDELVVEFDRRAQ